jgi:ubiquinone/menaquinone biosynthesis C-methylase UbiE
MTVEDHYGKRGVDMSSLDSIVPFAEFHTLGPRATSMLAEAAGIEAGESVLDVGCGIGGPARHLASKVGAVVSGVDLTPEFCEAAVLLNRKAGLDIPIFHGSALDLPFDDASFDVVWTQHVTMNIEDKATAYREMRRVVRPGGRLAFFDVIGGREQPIHFPVPWAEEQSISHLVTEEWMRRLVTAAGFSVRLWEDHTEDALAAGAGGGVDNPLIPNFAAKVANHRRNLEEDRARVLLAVCDAD